MRYRIFILAMSIIMVAQFRLVVAQSSGYVKDDWTLLGTHEVNYLIDRDVVNFQGNSESVSALKFTTKGGQLNVHKCTIHFADGKTTDVDFESDGKKNAPRNLTFDLEETKPVEKITFWYNTDRKSENKATLEVWGKKD